jgi:hypothetical protein
MERCFPRIGEEGAAVQNAEDLMEAVAGEAMQVGLDILLVGITAACVLLMLVFVVGVLASVISELRGAETQRNVSPGPT